MLSFVGDEFVKPESGRPRKQRNNATHADTPIKVNSIRYRKPQRGVGKTAKNVAQNHGNNLRRGSSLGSRIDVEDEIQGEAFTATEERSSGDDIVHYVDTVEEVGELLDAALRELIGDGRKRSKGVKVVRQAAMPSLVGIAPAVWSLGYLQVSWVAVAASPAPYILQWTNIHGEIKVSGCPRETYTLDGNQYYSASELSVAKAQEKVEENKCCNTN